MKNEVHNVNFLWKGQKLKNVTNFIGARNVVRLLYCLAVNSV